MSDIPRARRVIDDIVARHYKILGPSICGRLRFAVSLMYRVQPDRRAPAKRQVIDYELRHRVKALRRTTDLTQHEIANRVGLRSSGRISEIVHHKR